MGKVWLLILLFERSAMGVPLAPVEFTTREQCEAVIASVRASLQANRSWVTIGVAVCIEKDGLP